MAERSQNPRGGLGVIGYYGKTHWGEFPGFLEEWLNPNEPKIPRAREAKVTLRSLFGEVKKWPNEANFQRRAPRLSEHGFVGRDKLKGWDFARKAA